MTLTELKYAIAVARERHFGKAAEACFVSQPSLSVAVKKLEDELGVAIFERRSNDIALTPVGQLIIDQAQRVIEESRLIKEIAKEGQDPLNGPLRVGVIFTVGPFLLPKLIQQMNQTTGMPLYLEENYTTDLLNKLRLGQIDVAITANTISDTGFCTQEIYQEDFLLAVPSHHPWVNRTNVNPSELKDQTMLLLGQGHCFRDQILGVCPDIIRMSVTDRSDVQRTVEGSSLQTICHMVAQGLGITVLPASAVPYLMALNPDVRIIPFKQPSPSRRILLVWRKSFPRTAAVHALRDAMCNVHLEGCVQLKSDVIIN